MPRPDGLVELVPVPGGGDVKVGTDYAIDRGRDGDFLENSHPCYT